MKYKGLSVAKKPMLFQRGSYGFDGIIHINNHLDNTQLPTTLEHEYQHHIFYQKHKWIKNLFHIQTPSLVIGILLYHLSKNPLFLALVLPFIVAELHEIDCFLKTKDYLYGTLRTIFHFAVAYLLFASIDLTFLMLENYY